jgi:hypothetical protein
VERPRVRPWPLMVPCCHLQPLLLTSLANLNPNLDSWVLLSSLVLICNLVSRLCTTARTTYAPPSITHTAAVHHHPYHLSSTIDHTHRCRTPPPVTPQLRHRSHTPPPWTQTRTLVPGRTTAAAVRPRGRSERGLMGRAGVPRVTRSHSHMTGRPVEFSL